ncbi:unnamed protein product [Brassica rapa]|uniref:Uncharacterized protein n=2 Tax=Brassica campestris TaxID=3711 RepID=A0A8D9LV52_BRACM|nr:unnamed protein product [Brassica rapa]
MEVEGAESMKSRKEQERERRRLKDRERRRYLSEDERERHLARRLKNYQLRKAESRDKSHRLSGPSNHRRCGDTNGEIGSTDWDNTAEPCETSGEDTKQVHCYECRGK